MAATITMKFSSTPELNIGELANSSVIKCSVCCSSTFKTADDLRQHLSVLQSKLDDIHCYACNEKMDNLSCYLEHIETCLIVQLPEKKSHITTIECSTFSQTRSELVSPSKLAMSGLKIIKVPVQSDSLDHHSAIKNLTPLLLTDQAMPNSQVVSESVYDLKRPSSSQSEYPGKAKIPAMAPRKFKVESGLVSFDEGMLIDHDYDMDVSDVMDEPEPMILYEEHKTTTNTPIAQNTQEVQMMDLQAPTLSEYKPITYKCKRCDFKTTNIEIQKKHHCASISCPYCDKKFLNNAMAAPHIRKHKLDLFETELNVKRQTNLSNQSEYCIKCKKYVSITLIDLHHKIHGEGGIIHNCLVCLNSFVTKLNFNQHKKDCASITVQSISEEEFNQTLPEPDAKSYKCGYCHITLYSIASLSEHIKNLHKSEHQCTECELAFQTGEKLLAHIKVVHGKEKEEDSPAKERRTLSISQYDCNFCDVKSSKKLTMVGITKHIIFKHSEVEPEINLTPRGTAVCVYFCTVCNDKVNNVDLHTKLHRSGLEVHTCKECSLKFISFGRLSKHMEQDHKIKISEKAFQCTDCPKVYDKRASLLIHAAASNHSQRLLQGKSTYNCRYCKKPHLRIRDLWKHEKMHLNQGDTPLEEGHKIDYQYSTGAKLTFTCNECNKIFATKIAAEVHVVAKSHMKGYEYLQPLSCANCGKKFARKRELQRHVLSHTKDGFVCDICGKKWATQNALRKHSGVHSQFKCCHCKKHVNSEQDLIAHVKEKHADKSDLIKCNFCVKYFLDSNQLKEHFQSLDHIECQMNETVPLSNDLFMCEICQEYVFADLKQFHEILHSRGVEKFFNCSACSKRFCSLTNLRMHTQTEHGNAATAITFACPKCNAKFNCIKSFSYHFKKHTLNVSDLKKFPCRYCTSSFRKAGDRGKHELIHQGIKPHPCTLCPKTFRLACMLQVHMRTHTNERPFACSECDLTFKTHSAKRNHILCMHRTDRPHGCKYCSKMFKTRNALYNHVGQHEMLFKCNDCGRNFPTRNAATRHIKKIHLVKNRELYQCIICNAAYGRSLFLAKHMKTHGKLDEKEDLVQQLIEMSHVDSRSHDTKSIRKRRTPKK